MTKLTFRLKGGPGSGHKDHKGIPGHHGGSLPDGKSGGPAMDANWVEGDEIDSDKHTGTMSKQEVILDVKSQLRTIKGNLNSWSYRDRAKLIVNHVYGGGILDLGGKKGEVMTKNTLMKS